MYQGDPRGSQWNKWDLHVHTPASIEQSYGDCQQGRTWGDYLDALEALPKEIRVVAINDYFCIDGYRRILEAKQQGRLTNLQLILPAVELRLSSYAGHSDLRKINFHVIFSDELTPDQIDGFFLNSLMIDYRLDDGKPWCGPLHSRDALREFGRAIQMSTPSDKRSHQSDLRVGFMHASFPRERIDQLLTQSIFSGKVLTAVGLSEWDQMRWDDGSAAVKKDIVNNADLVLTASPSVEQYEERHRQLVQQGVNSRLLDCSDAHYYADSDQSNRLGQVFTWLKSDLTFSGLKRVIQRFDDRVCICDLHEVPPKRELIRKHPGKFIRSISIRKDETSDLDEIWFDGELSLNPDMVSIIGNQGNGKSALTDILALCGNSQVGHFSFLTPEKFCDQERKARHFTARLMWEDGTVVERRLDEPTSTSDMERVRYIPQSFFDAITNETVVSEGGQFYSEIKKAIFSHISDSDRLECADFDELLGFRTDQHVEALKILRRELGDLNRRIATLERDCKPRNVDRLLSKIELKKAEIAAHRANEPAEIAKPVASDAVNNRIEEIRRNESEMQQQVEVAQREQNQRKRQCAILDQKKRSIANRNNELATFLAQLRKELHDADLSDVAEKLVWEGIATRALTDKMEKISNRIEQLSSQLNLTTSDSLAHRLASFRRQREALEQELELESQAYQSYLTERGDWENRLRELIGDKQKTGSLRELEDRLVDLVERNPQQLDELRQLRREKSKEIYQQLVSFSEIYKDLTAPVRAHIRKHRLTREKYRIEFNIELFQQDISERLFELIKNSSGTFTGIEAGRAKLNEIATGYDFSSPEDIIAFAEEVLDNIVRDHREMPPTPVDIAELIRKGKREEQVYDLLFGLEYLSIQYALALNGKPLKKLSPGERGILLLVFYLIVDQGTEPLIIDQPEGNLNNQSIFDNLVPVFKEAKKCRQLVVVTHNPNLAVVCDAEQIVHARIEFKEGNRVQYESGALENPLFNRLSLDVLEGTPPAFEARRLTYEPYT